jgi:hypothetical protein
MSFFRRRRSKNVGAQEYDNQAADASPESSRGVTVHGARSITMPPFASSDDLRVAADNYAHVHQELERIVRSELVPSDRSAAVDILAAIGVAQPNIVLTSRELFQGMVSVMSLGPSEVEAWIADLEANTNTGTALVVNIKHRNVPTVLVAFRDLEGRYINYYCHPDVIRDWPLSGQQEQPPRSVEVGAAPATFTRAQASNPEEALSILFEQAVPAAGIADKTRVEEQYLPWHKNMGAEPRTPTEAQRMPSKRSCCTISATWRRSEGSSTSRLKWFPSRMLRTS